MSQSADSRYTVTYRYGSDGQRATKYARGMNESETMYFSKMWEWRYDEAAGGRERNSKHIFLGETRVVTKVLADASVVAGERESEYFYHSDHLGSAQLISDYEGREYERIEYTPYGETWVDRKEAVDTIELTYRFTGKEVDEETGLYYYGARYLDPRTSRWLSTDPALGEYIPGAPVNEEAKKANQNLPGMGGVFNVVNFQLYHYAGNNPVKYVDPDGRTNISIESTYKMNTKVNATTYEYSNQITGDTSGTRIYEGGCAISIMANIAATLGLDYNPSTINSTNGFVVGGDVQWSTIASSFSLTLTTGTGQFTHAMYNNQQNDTANNYYTAVKVQYTTDANSPHWVGVMGIETDDQGDQYLVISPTSVNDSSVGTGTLRNGQGWKKNSAGNILVPVDKVSEYRLFSKAIPTSEE